MAKKKRLPDSEDWHKDYYKELVCKYGYHQTGIEHVNKVFLDFINVEDTPPNRDALRDRMRSVNPNYTQCDEETRKEIKKKCADRSEIQRGGQDDRRYRLRQVLDDIYEQIKISDLLSDLTLTDLVNAEVRIDEHEAKLHGLYKHEPSKDTDPRTDTGDADVDTGTPLERQMGDAYEALSEIKSKK